MPLWAQEPSRSARVSPFTVFAIFLRLGLTSFGGPVAHLGYFHVEFVKRRRWLDERAFADLVALCQFLPGPASSQVGIALGLMRGGYVGGVAAWAGFTLPSAILLILFGYGVTSWGGAVPSGVLHGLKIVAVAVVAQAVWAMARSASSGALAASITAFAACFVLLWPTAWGQVGTIVASGLAGLLLFGKAIDSRDATAPDRVGHGPAVVALAIFAALLVGLPLAVQVWPSRTLALVDAFYRVGSLVFGGGHVVLPLLEAEVVPNGWVANEAFLAGYGAAQAVPGPLFTFAAFLGASMTSPPSGWLGGLICLVAIFLPSFLLVAGALPFWERLRGNARMRAALVGVNAGVVGLLLAALYDPVWTSAILRPPDFALALLAFVALTAWKLPPWLVVVASGAGGGLFDAVL